MRGKPERFADHYTQATLFWNSQTPVEQQHIINAFRFELSQVQTPAIRERMVSGLMNVAAELAEAVATGLGMRDAARADAEGAAERRASPRSTESPALSLFARPGDGGIRARRVAILVADGVRRRAAAGAGRAARRPTARCRDSSGPRSARVAPTSGDGDRGGRDLAATPSVLFDAMVLPDGAEAVDALWRDGRALEFVKDQYRHCKPILVLGARVGAARRGGIPRRCRSGKADPGC